MNRLARLLPRRGGGDHYNTGPNGFLFNEKVRGPPCLAPVCSSCSLPLNVLNTHNG